MLKDIKTTKMSQVMKSQGQTFIVDIKSTQNNTWQGTVNWVGNQEIKPFRSALELMKLIDSALEESQKKKKSAS